MSPRTLTQSDAVAQVVWNVKAVPVRLASRLAPSWASRSARDARKVHLGCGSNLFPGWANLDMDGPAGVVRFDLSRPLPFGTGTVDLVYSEHFIEHLRLNQAVRLLHECHRILRPGGVLRLSTPDLRFLVDEYRSGRTSEWSDMDWVPESPCDLINEGMRLWGHRYLWDEQRLTQVLLDAGFSSSAREERHRSNHEDLRGLESRPDHTDLIVEAIR